MADATVDVWAGRLDDARLLAAADCLDPEELDRAARFATVELRDRYVVSHVALRTVLAPYAGSAAAGVRFDRTCLHCGHDRHGRPRLADGAVEFSLSHGGDLWVVAVAAQPVGADVEPLGGRTRTEGLARKTMSQRERARLERLGPDRREAAFLDLWCRKEAYLKGIGVGIVVPLAQVDVLGDEAGAADTAAVVDGRVDGRSGWRTASAVFDDHVCAIATEGAFTLLRRSL